MQYPQTRYVDTINPGITDTALLLTCGTTPPTRTQGILTIGRVQSNTEDVYFTNVAGNNVTIGLRGLSQTALTLTSVVGNQKIHQANESLEMTTHHNYDTDLLRKSEDDTVAGNITFTLAPRVPGLKDANGNATITTPATASAVNNLNVANSATGNNVILSPIGADSNINVEIQGKGTGYVVLPDKSELKTNAAPVFQNDIANKKYVDDQVATFPTINSQVYYPTTQVYGETIAANSEVYQDPTTQKWFNITSAVATWYYPQGFALDAGVLNDTGKRILKSGSVTGQSFANINPTFSSSGTGTDLSVGQAVGSSAQAFLVSNFAGAECIVTGGTISTKQVGTPGGSLQIYLVLESSETGANYPAAFRDTSNNVMRGAIIGSATIVQALFSGTYQNLAFSFGSNITIPAGSRVYLVVSKVGAVDASNYYLMQSSGASAVLNQTTMTWSGTANSGNLTLTVVSTSPVGYAVKAFTGLAGSYGLTPSNPWSRVIGRVISATEFYFNPEAKMENVQYTDTSSDGSTSVTFKQITTNFCPSSVRVALAFINDAAADTGANIKGYIRGDSNAATTFNPTGFGNGSFNDNYLANNASWAISFSGSIATKLFTNGAGTSTMQNILFIVRLENGFYMYCGYPSGTGFVSAGAGTFVRSTATYELESKV